MAEEGNTVHPLKDPQSATSLSAAFPPQPSQTFVGDERPAPPRTIGGFVDDDDDAEEGGTPQSDGVMSSSSEYEPNINGGTPSTPEQQHPPPNAVSAPSLSRPQSSSMALPPPVSSNTDQEPQNVSDSAPVQTQATSDAHVSHGPTDAVPSPTASQAVAASRASANPTPLNASNVSRPVTANGVVAQSPTTSAPSARLPSDRIGMLEDRISEDPKGDTEAWRSLIDEYKRRGKIAEVRKTYDNFLSTFPTNADQWTAYVNFELDQDKFSLAEQILQKSVTKTPNIGLWTTYLNYIRRRHALTGSAAETNRKIVSATFDYILDGVGIDKDAGRLWQEYIDFLKSGPGTVGGADWQDKQKMDLLRKAFHQAISIPTEAVELLWREYDSFEMGLSKMAGRKFLQEKSEDYMTARSSKTSLQNLTRGLNRSTTPVLPPMPGCEGDEEYMRQVHLWKRWVSWEKEDPLVLKDDQSDLYQKRVLYVYKQATVSLRFWPEMWFEAAEYCYEQSLNSKGDEFLDEGIEANPESCLLAFKKAERVESSTTNGDTEASIKERGDKVRAPFDTVLNALYALVTKVAERENAAIAELRENFSHQTGQQLPTIQGTEPDDDDQEAEQRPDPETVLRARIEALSKAAREQKELYKKLITSAWISLMRAMRRVQGKGNPQQGMRGIFIEARKRGQLNSEFYIASALLEHHCYKDPTAIKIFDRGLKLFPEDEYFATEYIKHLINTNDTTNARVVFEQAVNKMTQKEETKPKAKPIFALFHNYEALYGELEQIKKLEKRISALYPEDPQLVLFGRRHAEAGFDPCAVRPVVSPKMQTQPKISTLIEQVTKENVSPQGSPRPGFAAFASGPDSPHPSPKRPLDDSDNEMPARKIARGDSPLKGAAGRRLDAARRTTLKNELTPTTTHAQLPPQPPPPPPIPRPVYDLLRVIPHANTYTASRFDAQKMAQLLRSVDMSKADLARANAQYQSQQQPSAPPSYPQQSTPQYYYNQAPQPTPQPSYGQQQAYFGNANPYGFTR